MLWWSYRLHLKGFRFTADHADTTAKTLLRVDDCLVFLTALRAFHLYSVELATVYAYLAAITVIEINIGRIAALLPA